MLQPGGTADGGDVKNDGGVLHKRKPEIVE